MTIPCKWAINILSVKPIHIAAQPYPAIPDNTCICQPCEMPQDRKTSSKSGSYLFFCPLVTLWAQLWQLTRHTNQSHHLWIQRVSQQCPKFSGTWWVCRELKILTVTSFASFRLHWMLLAKRKTSKTSGRPAEWRGRISFVPVTWMVILRGEFETQ